MNDRAFLHDSERLLCSMKASPAVLMSACVRALLEGVIVGGVLSFVLFLVDIFALQIGLPPWLFVLIILLSIGIDAGLRIRMWRHSTLRITSERILLQNPFALFHGDLHTIKWPQYQESQMGHRRFLDLFFLSRPIVIRYGTADALNEASFPSLRYAQDLKHYLDKVDSAVRRNDVASVQPFIAKPRGKRDIPQ